MTAFAAQIDDGVDTAVALGQLPPSEAVPADAEVEPIVVPTAPAAASDPNVVEITFYTPVGLEEVLRPLARQFQESHPDIRIRFMAEEIVLGVEQDSLLNRAAGSDCTIGRTFDLDFEDGNLGAVLLPLGPLLDLDTTMQAESFYPALLQELTVDGELIGLPLGVPIPYLEYNRRLFEEAGVPEPTVGWTLDDFLEAALQLSSGEGETRQYAYALPFRTFLVQNAAIHFDVQLIDYNEPVPNFDYPAATEMLTWYTDLIRTHEVQPFMAEDIVTSRSQFDVLLQEERIAMWAFASVNFYYKYLSEEVPLPRIDLGIAPHPVGPNGVSQPPSFVQAYFIFADSPHAAACWEWIRFLATEPSAAYRPEQAFQMLPGHIETAESQAYADIVGAEIAAIGLAYINSLPSNPQPPMPDWMWPGSGWLVQAYYDVVTGESDVTAALATAEARFSQYRQCVIEQDAFEDEAAQESCEASVE
ncbi:MAG: extracellular solute-binding protein [Candidatus Promineifilaceae bacterium]